MATNEIKFTVSPAEEIQEIKDELRVIKEMLKIKEAEELKDEYLSGEEARKVLSVSRKTFQSYRDRRLFEFSQYGRKILIKRTVLEEFIKSNRITK